MMHRPMLTLAAALLAVSVAGCDGTATAEQATAAAPAAMPAPERIQHNLIGSDFPIARAVEVTAGTGIVWHSGMTPRPANPDAEKYSPEYWGDTETQAMSALTRMDESLKDLGLTFDDIIKMTVFMVPDPANDGRIDFQGFMKSYTKFFGKDAGRMKLPARSAVGVAQLAAPGMLIEIEAVFARPAS